jgi:hypothetical protein
MGALQEDDEIFENALDKALEDLGEEARTAGYPLHEALMKELGTTAYQQRGRAFGQSEVDGPEKDYRKALADASIPWSGRPWLGFLRWVVVIAFVGVLLGANVMHGYSAALSGPPGSYNDVSVFSGAVLGQALLTLLGLATLCLVAYLFIWKTTRLKPEALVAGTVLAAICATILLTFSTHSVVANLSDSGVTPGWELLVLIVATTTDVLFFTAPIRLWWLTHMHPSTRNAWRQRVHLKEENWQRELAETIKSILRERHPAINERRFETTLKTQEAPGLRRVRDTTLHVENEAERLLVRVSKGMDGGSIAISGPRGVGKTELLDTFCTGRNAVPDAPVGMSVVVTAPIVHDRREFMLYLFTELCERAQTLETKPLRNEAIRHLRWIRYLQTSSSQTSLNATVRSLGLSISRGTSLARVPLTYPEIVKTLKDFLTVVAAYLEERKKQAGRLVIGIDELDRIQPAASAREFLNEIKAIFDVRNCLFVLSVSDDALHKADLAPVGRRDVFDSAIDEVIRVEPLTQKGAMELLNPRVLGGVPEAFGALFNCLAGGIPRGLLRNARAALLFSGKEQHTPPEEAQDEGEEQQARSGEVPEETLSETTERLVARELARITSSLSAQAPPVFFGPFHGASMRDGSLLKLGERLTERTAGSPEWEAIGITAANRLFFLDTVLGVFSPTLSEDMIRDAVDRDPDDTRSFTALAKTGSYIGVNDHQARTALQAIRDAWGLKPQIPDIAPPRPLAP